MEFRKGTKNDLDQIGQLLQSYALPTSDINNESIQFIVGVKDNNVLACIGLESFDRDGLLRSFAVSDSVRNTGVGKRLLQIYLGYCREAEIGTLHLLTTTAKDYFLKKGFAVSEKKNAPVSILNTTEFSSLCPDSSIYMTLALSEDIPLLYADDLHVLQNDNETDATYWAVRGKQMSFTYFEVPPDRIFDTHFHESEQITHVLEGALYFEIDNEEYCVCKGDSIVIPSNKPHKVWTKSKTTKAVDSWSPVMNKYGAS